MTTISLDPQTIAAYEEIITNPKQHGFDFVSISDFFEKSESVTAKHILAEAYMKYINKPLPKVILYIIMDRIFGQCTGKDEKGFAGYHLKIKL